MTKNPKSKGDKIAPGLAQSKNALQASAALANQPTAAMDTASKAAGSKTASNLGAAMAAQTASRPPVISCQQLLWFSFFFDGTGNNLDADLGTLEHSNITRLYRVHPVPDPVTGLYSIYVPGIGTYFKEVGDNGGTITGNGFGAEGKSRLDWALKQFDEKLAPHLARANNPSNKIIEINITAFGFSRRATLARAFIRDLIAKRCVESGAGLQLKQGKYPLRVRFMGLFDTVASVGAPMSANNLSVIRTDRMTVGNAVRALGGALKYAVTKAPPKTLRAVDIAFGAPGADPAPGIADGHAHWADGLHIPPAVEHAVHYVAAHEIRNSFPVDSVCDGGRKPGNCKEIVYPGAHSNVGGGYRPGEEGKSADAVQMLSQIPLRHMYDEALDMGVPLLPEKAWQKFNRDDFDTSSALKERYNHYMSLAGRGGKSLGKMMNAHMAVYYAWRFAQIRRKQKGDQSLARRIEGNEAQYRAERQKADREIAELTRKEKNAQRDVAHAERQRGLYISCQSYGSTTPAKLKPYNDVIATAQQAHSVAQDELLRAKAKRDTMPGESDALIKNLEQYDAQLIADARSLRDACLQDPAQRSRLRPHYRGLLEAYENEFFLSKGLTDEKIFAFFENHIHDSLAGFATDSTLPSDPRVVYLGKDMKSQHAMNEKLNGFTEQESIPA
jgi:uncharacterized protein (DUF2235 family)